MLYLIIQWCNIIKKQCSFTVARYTQVIVHRAKPWHFPDIASLKAFFHEGRPFGPWNIHTLRNRYIIRKALMQRNALFTWSGYDPTKPLEAVNLEIRQKESRLRTNTRGTAQRKTVIFASVHWLTISGGQRTILHPLADWHVPVVGDSAARVRRLDARGAAHCRAIPTHAEKQMHTHSVMRETFFFLFS